MLGGDASHPGLAGRTTRSTTIELRWFIAVGLCRESQCGGDTRNRSDTASRQQIAAFGDVALAVTVAVVQCMILASLWHLFLWFHGTGLLVYHMALVYHTRISAPRRHIVFQSVLIGHWSRHRSIHQVNDGNLILHKHFNTCQPGDDCHPQDSRSAFLYAIGKTRGKKLGIIWDLDLDSPRINGEVYRWAVIRSRLHFALKE